MYRLKALKDLLARVKWTSVGAFALLVLMAAALYWSVSSGSILPSAYKGTGDVQVRAWADPARVDLWGKTSAWVEVKNRGDDGQNVLVKMEIDDKDLSFADTGDQRANKTIQLGSGESRRLNFPVSLNASSGGQYGIRSVVLARGETIEEKIFLDVYEK